MNSNLENLKKTIKYLPIYAIIFLFFSFYSFASASTYYVDSSITDTNVSSATPDCTNYNPSTYLCSGGTSSAYKTLADVNTKSYSPGDSILFKKGDTFYGTITVSQSGTAGNPITFSSYGTGNQPIITGFTTVSGWTNLGNNIWESTNAVSTLSTLNMVTVNDVNTAMGRIPNLDNYYTLQSHSSNASITSNDLTGTPDWTGAQVVIRKESWIWQIGAITSQSGSTISYTDEGTFTPQNNWGFFIQNDIRTLDSQNEWYYNPTTKKISIYSTSEPINVKVASVENLVSSSSRNYVTIDNILFTGANTTAVYLFGGTHTIVSNCTINYSGLNGVYLSWSTYSTVDSNFIKDSNYAAIFSETHNDNAMISNNTIDRTSMILGVGLLYAPSAIISGGGNYVTISGNKIDHSGYNGILTGNAHVINNFINHSLLNRSDGAGIYVGGTHTDLIIDGNIVLNTFGYTTATANGYKEANGIYLDAYPEYVTVSNNISAYNGTSGIYLNLGATHNTISGNTSFGNASSQLRMETFEGSAIINNNTVINNKFISKSSTELVAEFRSALDNIPSFFTTSDNNYFARPINDTNTIRAGQPNSYGTDYKTLAQWQTFSGQDANSKKSPVVISSESDIFFDYNTTTSNKTVSLPWPSVDMDGTKVTGNITILPYSSVIYLKDPNPGVSDTTAPTISSFTIPSTSTTLSVPISTFTASDAVGVTGYLLTETSTTPSASSGSWSSTVPTTYTFSTEGSKTLYAWAKDAAGNISTSVSDTVVITLSTGPTTYYISPTGSNSNSGSISSPWSTLAYACSRVNTPGNVIHIEAGIYIETSQCVLDVGVSIEGEGDTSVIKSDVTSGATIILDSNTLNESGINGNQHISNIKMDGDNLMGKLAIQVINRSNVSVHDCYIIDFAKGGIMFAGGYYSSSTYETGNSCYNNTIINSAGFYPAGDKYSGISYPALNLVYQDGTLVYNNTMNQTQRSTGSNGDVMSANYIKGVKIYDNTFTKAPYDNVTWDFVLEFLQCKGGIEIYNNIISGDIDLNDLDKGNYNYSVDFHNNIIGNNTVGAYQERGLMIESTSDVNYASTDIIIRNNYFKNLTYGVVGNIHAGGVGINNLSVYYNIFNKTSGFEWLGNISSTITNINIWNNIFYANDMAHDIAEDGIELPDVSVSSNVSVRNNIINGYYRSPIFAYNAVLGSSINIVSIENNNMYGNGHSNTPYFYGITPTNVTTKNNIISDPSFVSSSDFHLQSTSPAINVGVNVGLTSDYEGNPIVGLPDIGAYESNYSAPTATTYTLTGPTSGNINTASTNFTITPNNTYTGTITITPSGTGATGLSPIVKTFSNSSTAQTFTITPTVAGSITLTPTNNGGLTNPSNLTYTSVVPQPTTYTLTINKSGTGTGTTTGANTYTSGTVVTATATPDSGSTFTSWSGDCNTSGVVTMTKDMTCTATFTLIPVVTPPSSGGGGGSSSSSSSSTTTPTTLKEKAKAKDIKQDGSINIFDFNIIMANWNKTYTTSISLSKGDMTMDGVINIFDINQLMIYWGVGY